MAYVGITNQAANNTSGLALYVLKEALKLAGWVVLSSGTGTSGTTAASDLITTGTGTAIGSFARANAWVRVREPGAGTRQYILQNGNADNSVNVIIKYSRSTGFTTGATATVAPTTGGGDGIVWIGTGTDASPVQGTWLPGAATGYYHAVANDAAVNGVYGFWWYGYLAGGSSQRMIGTEAVAAGSTASSDGDQSVRYRDNLFVGGAGNTVQWWEAYGLGGAVYRSTGNISLQYNAAASVIVWPGTGGSTSLDPYTGRVPMWATFFVGQGFLPKGYSTELAVFATTQNPVDTFNLSTANPKIALYTSSNYGTAFPWVTSVVPLV